MEFKARLTKPDASTKYYIHYTKGGYNTCIVISGNSVLPNCVGYAHGRFLEIQGKTSVDWTIPNCNAKDFLTTAKNKGYKTGDKPKLGAIIVWGTGTSSASSCGHVGVVEKINADGSIVTSESGYGCTNNPFWTKTRKNDDGNWGQKGYKFLGFIYQKQEYTAEVTTSATNGKKTIYRVQVGVYEQKSNAEQMAARLKAMGFDAIIKTDQI